MQPLPEHLASDSSKAHTTRLDAQNYDASLGLQIDIYIHIFGKRALKARLTLLRRAQLNYVKQLPRGVVVVTITIIIIIIIITIINSSSNCIGPQGLFTDRARITRKTPVSSLGKCARSEHACMQIQHIIIFLLLRRPVAAFQKGIVEQIGVDDISRVSVASVEENALSSFYSSVIPIVVASLLFIHAPAAAPPPLC